MDKVLDVNDLAPGRQVFVVPLRAGIAMSGGRGQIPEQGRRLRVDDYVIGLARRGVVRVYDQAPVAPVAAAVVDSDDTEE